MAKSQIDPGLIPKIQAICAGQTDHITLMAVIAEELFNAVNWSNWVGITRRWHRAR